MEDFLETNRTPIAAFCFGVLFTLLSVWFYSTHLVSSGQEEKIEIIVNSKEENTTSKEYYVYGAVNTEGIIEVEAGESVLDKVKSFGERGDADYAVVEQYLSTCEECNTVYVPFQCVCEEPSISDDSLVLGESVSAGECININTASKSALISLPGIGEKRAALIIEGRPYNSVSEITRVKGIGDKILEDLKPLICL